MSNGTLFDPSKPPPPPTGPSYSSGGGGGDGSGKRWLWYFLIFGVGNFILYKTTGIFLIPIPRK